MDCCWSLHYFSCLHFLLLAIFQKSTDAYISVDLASHCIPEGPPSVLNLQTKSTRSAALVELNVKAPFTPAADRDTGDARCLLEVVAPPGHQLTVHLDHPEGVKMPRTLRKRQGFLPCFLKLARTGEESDDIETLLRATSRTIDLCDGGSTPVDTLFMASHLTLAWSPPNASLAGKMVATRLVITAVGTGADVCDSRHLYFCLGGSVHFPVCIPSELACDGHNNCPLAEDDEAPEHCDAVALTGGVFLPLSSDSSNDDVSVLGNILKNAVLEKLNEGKSGKRDVTTSKPGQNKQSGFELATGMLRDVSDIILKKLMNKHKGVQVTEPSTTTTTTTKAPWQETARDPTLTAALAHYGPWGYLMLGMLICGAILMLCGLWECCCRSSKHRLPAGGPTSTSAATTVFIINSAGGIGSPRTNSAPQQDDAPPGAEPPSYEELDQPPPYSSLFPATKICNMERLTVEENRVIGGEHI